MFDIFSYWIDRKGYLKKKLSKLTPQEKRVWKDRKRNNSLHMAAIIDDWDLAKEMEGFSDLKEEKNRYGFSPIDIAKYLHRKEISALLLPISHKKITLNREGITHISIDEYEKLFEVEYLDSLYFSSYNSLTRMAKRSKRAMKRSINKKRQNYLGAYWEKEILFGYHPNLRIEFRGADIGWGLFAEEDIPKEGFIGEYTGLVRRYKYYSDQRNAYCFEYLLGSKSRSPFTIDARDKGNLTRFINHSETPNIEPLSAYSRGVMHLILVAKRAIQKGEELTYDYGPNYWARREAPLDK